jgi:hypothetical protein
MDVALGSLEKPELPLGVCSLIGIQENLICWVKSHKNSDQDVSNEGSNFILSLVEVVH